jgi:isocitrate lyase
MGSVPRLVKAINSALEQAYQIHRAEGTTVRTGSPSSSLTPRRASAANLNAFELTNAMIEAGAAGVHFEDQLSSAKKCGHMGGKVLVPTLEFEQKLAAAPWRQRRGIGLA